jgi:hypothetical protein
MNTVPRRLGYFLLRRKDYLEKNGVSEYREWNTILGNWDIIPVRRRKGDVEIGTLDPRAEPGAVICQKSIVKGI